VATYTQGYPQLMGRTLEALMVSMLASIGHILQASNIVRQR